MGRNTSKFNRANTVLHEQQLKIDSVMQQHNLFINQGGDPSGKKFNKDEFVKKYESQRIKWERLKNSPPVNYKLEEEEKELEEATFKPIINPRSKQLVRDLEKIENRVKVLNEGRDKKIREMQEAAKTQYTFRPQINRLSTQLANKREVSTSPVGERTNKRY
jgi:hypothetical protein